MHVILTESNKNGIESNEGNNKESTNGDEDVWIEEIYRHDSHEGCDFRSIFSDNM